MGFRGVVLVLIAIIILLSCDSNKVSISITPDLIPITNSRQELKDYKLIYYIDNIDDASCIDCAIKGLYTWNNLYDEDKKNVNFYIIIKSDKYTEIKSSVEEYFLDIPIYLDVNGDFILKNNLKKSALILTKSNEIILQYESFDYKRFYRKYKKLMNLIK